MKSLRVTLEQQLLAEDGRSVLHVWAEAHAALIPSAAEVITAYYMTSYIFSALGSETTSYRALVS